MKDKFTFNDRRIFYASLSFENYVDFKNYKKEAVKYENDIKNIWVIINKYNLEKNNLSLEEKYKLSLSIIKKINTIIDKIGIENFLFDNNGYMQYKC